MILTTDFYNKLVTKINGKYFPDSVYYENPEKATKARYKIELFNNGCLFYSHLVLHLSLLCNDSKENIHNLVKEYVIDFEDYVYDENEEIDLFDFPELIPANVQEILDSFSLDENEYDICQNLISSLESIGYTCDYGLDAIPYGLKKL